MDSREVNTSSAEGYSLSAIADHNADLPDDIKPVVHGSGSVAHQIIGQFVDELSKDDAFVAIATRLEAIVFTEKLTEANLRVAIFGEIDL